ncbi:MAG: histidinol-phosphate aminotransferase family protein [Rhodothermales bacterium]|nr:histidinol-phosphate aminotransferase family protein [Rhodothermales bacterium]MBO6780975.1 histidinol-phosphate aminotransferase family protein [Rhodothermales bacterium]
MNRRQWLARSSTAAAGMMLAMPSAARATAPTSLRHAGTAADPIRLHSNENPFGPSDGARQAMMAAMDASWKYPSESYPALIAQIAAAEGVSEDMIFLGAGSHEVLRVCGTLFGISGGHLVAPFPTYEAFGAYADAVGGLVERVPLTPGKEIDLTAVEGAVTDDTRLVFICNPNNPTGRIVPSADLNAFISRMDGRCAVLVDEAYHEYVDHPGYESCVPLVKQGADVVVSRTFSKIFGLAGLRVGYAIGRATTVRRLLDYRNRHSVSSVSVAAAMGCYNDADFVAFSRRENAAGREIVYQAAADAGMTSLESQGNYVFVHVGEPIARFQRRMAERGIRVGRAFQPYTDWARISIGTRAEMDQFAQALVAVSPEIGQ